MSKTVFQPTPFQSFCRGAVTPFREPDAFTIVCWSLTAIMALTLAKFALVWLLVTLSSS